LLAALFEFYPSQPRGQCCSHRFFGATVMTIAAAQLGMTSFE